MTNARIKSNLCLAAAAGVMMAGGAWMIMQAPSDPFALMGLTVCLLGVGIASVMAWRVSL